MQAIIDVLRGRALSYMMYADLLEQLEQHPPDQAMVTLHLTDGLVLRASHRARWQLGIPLPVEG